MQDKVFDFSVFSNHIGNEHEELATVCDVWADKSYLFQQLSFEKEQENIPSYGLHEDVPYISKEHYLKGSLQRSFISNEEEALFCQWVEEDKKRRELADVRPALPSAVPENIARAQVHYYLTQLSNTEGWKYSETKKAFWIESRDEQQAKRIYFTATKAMHVHSAKNPKTEKEVTVCSNFTVSLMQGQAKYFPTIFNAEQLNQVKAVNALFAKMGS